MQYSFTAQEYQPDGTFQPVPYSYHLQNKDHWIIYRNGEFHLDPGPGYKPVRTVYCGICSTDLARKFLPYPLPQIIGHEVIVKTEDGSYAAVEINASHAARSHRFEECPFCSTGLGSQCPERITLGINVLPGGFSPMLLAPVNALVKVPAGVSTVAASLTEPFAAALQALESDPPDTKDHVAVLGVRRLGGLLLAALSSFRKEYNLDYKITAVIRHPGLTDFCLGLGADDVLDISSAEFRDQKVKDNYKNKFTKVYDTSGTEEGFKASLDFASETVHIKSTTGKPVMGLSRMTDLVVDELSILKLSPENLRFRRANDPEMIFRKKRYIWCSPHLHEESLNYIKKNLTEDQEMIQIPVALAVEPEKYCRESALPRFDMAVVTSLKEADSVIRPVPGKEFSFLRPGGAILLSDQETKNPPMHTLEYALLRENKIIRSSRCGNFSRALALLEKNPDLQNFLEKKFVSESLPLSQITEGFAKASDSRRTIKVLVRTEGPYEQR